MPTSSSGLAVPSESSDLAVSNESFGRAVSIYQNSESAYDESVYHRSPCDGSNGMMMIGSVLERDVEPDDVDPAFPVRCLPLTAIFLFLSEVLQVP